ncbi:MAG TPA: GNAT family N-acetyltransferase [Candidatus Thermoplasmatota archaeon]|nr:GNAT family N-acetyltransferase [Candidatus Thermoplasmatota archaeon]
MTKEAEGLAVRPAGPADHTLLLPMVRDLHRHEQLPRPGTDVEAALRAMLGDDRLGCVLVAEDAGRPVGYTVLGFGYSLEFHGRDAFVDELYVSDAARGNGIGSLLLDAAEMACRARGIKALHLESGHGNPRATALYGRRGFKAHERHLMTKWLD